MGAPFCFRCIVLPKSKRHIARFFLLAFSIFTKKISKNAVANKAGLCYNTINI